MRSIKLTLARADLLRALATLAATRRRGRSVILPVRLHFDEASSVLRIMEDRAAVSAEIAAKGSWPPMGATIDLFTLKRATGHCSGEIVELHALLNEILLHSGRWHVRLKLLKFGPESGGPGGEEADLPLFKWGSIGH